MTDHQPALDGPEAPQLAEGGGRRGLWTALGLVGVALLVGVVAALAFLVDSGEEDDPSSGPRTTSSATTDVAVGQVVTKALEAATAGDCDAVEALLTEDGFQQDVCSSEDYEALSLGGVEFEVGVPEVSGSTARVSVVVTSGGEAEDLPFRLAKVEGEWLIDRWGADAEPESTEAHTDPVPRGDSTASGVANDPRSVVEALIFSVVHADCATVRDLATAKYLANEGCDAEDVPEGFSEQVTWEVGQPTVDAAADTASVPVEMDFSGEVQSNDVTVVKVDGQWKVDIFVG